MNLIEVIKKRRSIRHFTNKPVEKEKIENLLQAAMFAPSAVNKQPWHFVVIDNKELMKKFMEIHPSSKMLQTANLAMLCFFQ